jgi:N-acetylmuramoyl-L-alanine amidase
MFKVIKLKYIILSLIIIVGFVSVGIGISNTSATKSPRAKYTLVIDAGHGGRDDGCSGITGTVESGINLAIAKQLQSYLETLDINVVMTRVDEHGLYDANATNFKVSDMQKRIEIIESAKPNMVISIHQNAYTDRSQYGAQVFFQEGDEESLKFGESIQGMLVQYLDSPRSGVIAGDYYLLKESKLPAVIVECGYLTNPKEEGLLTTKEYQDKVAYTIMCGVVKYFGLCG